MQLRKKKHIILKAFDYYILILNGHRLPISNLNSNNSQNQPLNILDINTKLSTQVNIKNNLITIDENEENFDPKLRQLCKFKIVVLEYLVEHLNNELLANNLHIYDNSVIDKTKYLIV
ncbi:10054_t:CDS:2, partial [Gigaspora margarita]